MTVSFVIFTIVYGTVSSILGTYIVRILDKKCKNDRHSSDSARLTESVFLYTKLTTDISIAYLNEYNSNTKLKNWL